MNRQEMYTQLQEKFVYVGPEPTYPTDQRDLAGPYHIDVFVQQRETGFKRLVKFYVKDLNRDTEEVIFEGWNPFATPTQSFAQQVNDYITSLISTGNVEYAKVDDINEATKRALCKFYIDENGTIVEKQAIVYYDETNQTMTHKFV
jgi:hypothetical protein